MEAGWGGSNTSWTTFYSSAPLLHGGSIEARFPGRLRTVCICRVGQWTLHPQSVTTVWQTLRGERRGLASCWLWRISLVTDTKDRCLTWQAMISPEYGLSIFSLLGLFCVYGCFAGTHVCIATVCCPWRSEEDVGSSRVEVPGWVVGNSLVGALGTKHRFYGKAAGAFNKWSMSPVPIGFILTYCSNSTAQHIREDMGGEREGWGSCSPCIYSQEAEWSECWCTANFLLFIQFRTTAHGKLLLIFGVNLPSSIIQGLKFWQEQDQGIVCQVIFRWSHVDIQY